MTLLSWALLIPFWLLLAAVAIGDVRNLQISNVMSGVVLAAAIVVLLFVREDPGPWWQHVASFAIMLAIGFGLFSVGWIGGGDAKFAAAAAVLFNLRELVWFVEVTALAGGVLALGLLALRRLPVERRGRWLGLSEDKSIPYGVAIAAGAIAVSALVAT